MQVQVKLLVNSKGKELKNYWQKSAVGVPKSAMHAAHLSTFYFALYKCADC